MSIRRSIISLGLVCVAAACAENPTSPPVASAPANPQFSTTAAGGVPGAQMHDLQQAPTAPPLETYQVSFWAFKNKSTNVRVQYLNTAPGGSNNFLQFVIPKGGLASGANGARLRANDSLQITLTIDPTTFRVNFQPSGVQFSTSNPASLRMWFQNANPDLNGDGVVDATDSALDSQLGMWTAPDDIDFWTKMSSVLDSSGKSVTADVYHFSGYVISW